MRPDEVADEMFHLGNVHYEAGGLGDLLKPVFAKLGAEKREDPEEWRLEQFVQPPGTEL